MDIHYHFLVLDFLNCYALGLQQSGMIFEELLNTLWLTLSIWIFVIFLEEVCHQVTNEIFRCVMAVVPFNRVITGRAGSLVFHLGRSIINRRAAKRYFRCFRPVHGACIDRRSVGV